MSHCMSPLQSFLIVCDPATSQPGLLVVSAGEEQELLDYHIKTTGTGTGTGMGTGTGTGTGPDWDDRHRVSLYSAVVCMIVTLRCP